ncbi:LptA/OstA family protein [Deinococcus hohokamensis]|uniref:LptA/OstA family protein n=1 Tax=Deinococcus hohokamensis TaxID=309883 RepID=A0ABV9I8Z8_9DEIO
MRFPAALLTLGLLLLPATQAQQGPATPPAPAAPATPPPAAEPATADEAAGCAEGQETSCTELTRTGDDGKERRITIVRTGTSDETGIDAVCGPREGEPEGTPTLLVLSESGPRGIEIRIDKNLIRVPLAIVTQKDAGEGKKSDGRIEASAGTARILEEVPAGASERLALCGVEATPKPAPDTVLVTQGRTQLKGQRLVYDEADGVARIEGPITFSRENGADSLSGKSQRIEVNVDAETTTLVGEVALNSAGGRVSRAARVEYDDARNLARLIGTPEQPAESIKGGDTLRAGMILYDLDRNEVYAVKAEGGTITGEFVEEGSSGAASGPAAPTSPTPTPPAGPPQTP